MARITGIGTDTVRGAGLSLLRRTVAVAIVSLALAVAGATWPLPAAAAPNDGCTVDGGTTANCGNVPVAGIKYPTGANPNVDTINLNAPDATPTIITNGVIGIDLTVLGENGADSSNPGANTQIGAFTTTVEVGGNDWTVVSTSDGGTPVTLPGGYYIRVVGGGVYDIGKEGDEEAHHFTTLEDLATYLQGTGTTGALDLEADLTINNPSTGGSAANIVTDGADGIHIQSGGGNGGNGGCSTVLLYTWCDSGKRGGHASSVEVDNDGSITTTNGIGVSATSKGGTGGSGGGSFGLLASNPGSGGDGGNGGSVTVVLGANSVIDTVGDNAHGVFASSEGGNGGKGGSSDGAVALGSKGGNGGQAGQVTVTNLGSITTNGDKAYGIFAQSVGAGAGKGSNSGGIIALGGNGGGESNGNLVTVTNTGTIETKGTNSYGIFAQSVGGGGGDGGRAGGLFTVGGDAGSGGGGNIVNVYNSGDITTHEAGSIGIFVQSVGGGGGNGGNAYSASIGGSVAVGGAAGLGGSANQVFVNRLLAGTIADLTAAEIKTYGSDAHGIQAQSVGGGGGNGGLAVAASVGSTVSASVAVGGTGGNGGAGNTVEVNYKGLITTSGSKSYGIFAQSVGGGGGNGGGAIAASASTGYSLGVSLGGTSGDGGSASSVNVNLLGGITTTNVMSYGIFAQSVGGGGGNGGYSVAGAIGSMSGTVALGGSGGKAGHGSTVTVTTAGIDGDDLIHTKGAGSHAIFAQSVGGGGGNGGIAVSGAIGGGAIGVDLGGGGAGGGNGGTVSVDNHLNILTEGAAAYGVLAQSVGGGGGNGGFSFAGSAGVMAASVAIGGKGGAGGGGGTVTLDNFGNVVTLGDGSYGLLAQSIGGGGGNGGGAVSATLTISVEEVPAIGAAVAVGGYGGAASLGGNVTITNDGSIRTGTRTPALGAGTPEDEIIRTGNGAHAIFAQSVGGSGGNGGFAGAAALSIGEGASFGVAVGGKGGIGGNAGAVEVVSTGEQIVTWGDGANGIYAQSVGGGGGDGGFGLAVAAAFSEGNSLAASVAIGGQGNSGGTGNTVTVDNSSNIFTDGKQSNGIQAQSIGGGGGNGGFAASGTLVVGANAVGLSVAVGGGAGMGNAAEKVTVDNSGAIVTRGENSLGILAQSIGGGGGNGGMSVVAQLAVPTENSGQVGVSIGGGAGKGGVGGQVEVTNLAAGDITTYGAGSHGIEAQSVGGGGGNGGLAIYAGAGLSGTEKALNVGVAVGGNGGEGGIGGTVTVTNDGNIRVYGDRAIGILAQSIGGGGGNGGNSVAAMVGVTNVTEKKAATANMTASVGGKGGSGNEGGAVSVTNTGTIITGMLTEDEKIVQAAGNYGIFAQSVGGGGGIGGRANAINIVAGPKCSLPKICEGAPNQSNNAALTATVGGNGGTAGHGGDVTVENKGEIITLSHLSDGIFAQSIGGGGGTGGNGILGTGEILPVPVELLFIPVGQTAIYKDISVAVGGNAGASGNGGVVDVTNSKNITTFGGNSNGIFAQSVGGGGGVGGNAVIGATGKLGVGGEGGASGDGGEVRISSTDNAKIETFGVASNGIFAQSVGGGGGVGGNVDRALAAGLNTPFGHLDVNLGIGLALGRDGAIAGAGGDGALVDVDVAGIIRTHGDSSAGIFAQSVGGGGGVQGGLGNDLPVLNLLSWHIGSNGDAGDGGEVTVKLKGTIQTAGNSANGIFAQSSGGTGSGGDVNVTVNGTIETAAILPDEYGVTSSTLRGYGSVGILAHSAGKTENGDVTVTVDAEGIVKGGRSGADPESTDFAEYVGVGIWIVDGDGNVVTNRGTVTTVAGVDAGYALYATGSDVGNGQDGGNETIQNYGRIIGSIDLGAGTNAFNNHADAIFDTGKLAYVGAANSITNDGTLNVGGIGKVLTTSLLGSYSQGAGATFGVDLDLARTGLTDEADLLTSQQTLSFDGRVKLDLLNTGYAKPGDFSVVIAHSDDATTAAGDPNDMLEAPQSAVAQYALSIEDGKDLLLSYGIDFDIAGLNPNESSLAEYINAVQLAGGSVQFAPIVAALFAIPDEEAYADALDQLLPEPYLANEVATLLASLVFENNLMSCRKASGPYRFASEGECVWANFGYRDIARAETENYLAYAQTVGSLSAGAQGHISDNLFGGVGFAYDMTAGTSGVNASVDGDRFSVGGVLKAQFGDTVVAGALVAGVAIDNVSRLVTVGPMEYLEGQQVLNYVAAHGRVSHVIESGDFYFKPIIDVGVTQVAYSDYEETGGPAALEIEGSSHTYVTVAPAIELGGEIALGEGTVVRPFARAGLTSIVAGDTPELTATLAGAPSAVEGFTIVESIDDLLYDVSLGFDLVSETGLSVRLNGEAHFGESITSYGAQLKIAAPL